MTDSCYIHPLLPFHPPTLIPVERKESTHKMPRVCICAQRSTSILSESPKALSANKEACVDVYFVRFFLLFFSHVPKMISLGEQSERYRLRSVHICRMNEEEAFLMFSYMHYLHGIALQSNCPRVVFFFLDIITSVS